jgi:hypothetical protein
MSRMIIGLCAFVLLAIPSSVQADPIVITSGSLSVVGLSGSPSYSLTGLNFSVTASGGDTGNTPNCFPCLSGTPVSLNSFLVGTSLGQGTATIDGTTFNNVGFLGEFSFGSIVVLPAGMTNITVMAPFTFTGNIRGCEGNPLICTTPVFSTVELVGQGIATANFIFSGIHASGATLYSFSSVTYQFQSSEIPEPMSIVLLTSGLIGLGARLKWRRSE